MCFVKYCEALRYYPLFQSDVLHIYEYCRNTKHLGQGKEFFIDVHNQLNTAAFFPHTQTHRLEKRADEIFLCEWQIIPYRHRRKNDGFSALFTYRTRTAMLSS